MRRWSLRPSVTFTLVFTLVATLAACGDSSTQPFRDERGLLLVSRANGQTSDIWAMRPDGSERRRLTRNDVWDTQPAWSPDGRRIAFVSARDSTPGVPGRRPGIYLMNADGSRQRRIHEAAVAAYAPRWSPDGTRIAFEAFDTSAYRFRPYVMNADGTGVTLLLDAPGENFSPDWSPDGRQIVFLSNRTPRSWWTMYVMNADGSGAHQLAGDEACRSNVGTPRWSRDGTAIVFSCDAEYPGVLYSIPAGGGTPTRLFTGSGAAWSPDGLQLAYNVMRNGGPASDPFVRNVADRALVTAFADTTAGWVHDWGGGR